jgi:hypothetical protein
LAGALITSPYFSFLSPSFSGATWEVDDVAVIEN